MTKSRLLITTSVCSIAVTAIFGASAFGQTNSPVSGPVQAQMQVSPNQSSAPSAVPPSGGSVAAAAEGNELRDIVVTARRVEENLQKVPLSVTALSAETLQERNVATVSDLQFSVPNLQIRPGQLFPSQPEFVIRGQRQLYFTDENVVTYVNGVPQNTRGLTLYDIESVQALKGPQGTLFGKNSMGGAMVFTTARPKFDAESKLTAEFGNYGRIQGTVMANVPIIDDKVAFRFAGQIERQDGFFKNQNPLYKDLNDRNNESARASLLINPDDRFENLTVVDYIHRNEIPTPSIIEAAPLSGNFFRSVTQQAVTIQSALGGSTPFVNTQDGVLERRGNPFVSVAQTGKNARLPGQFPALDNYASESEVYGVANITTYNISDSFSVKNIFGYRQEYALDYQDPSGISGMTFDFGELFGAPPGFVTGQATNNGTYFIARNKTVSDEFQLIGNLDNFKFIAGAFYSHTKRSLQNLSSFIAGPASFYGPQYEQRRDSRITGNSGAVFAQGTYDFSGIGLEGVRLTAGVRYTRDSRKSDLSTFYGAGVGNEEPFNPTTDLCILANGSSRYATAVNNGTICNTHSQRTFRALTWTDSLEYQAGQNTLIYFTNRRGFKAGGPNGGGSNVDFAVFGPERITDYEIGIKQQGRLGSIPYRVNIDGFIGKYKQIQTQDLIQFCSNPLANPNDGAACGAYTDLVILNIGSATIKGIEIDTSIKPVPPLELNFSYAYQIGRYGKNSIIPQPANPALPVANSNPVDFSSGQNLEGVAFAGVPRTTLSVSGTYSMNFVPESFAKMSLSANYYYRSKTSGLAVQGIYKTAAFNTVGLRLTFDDLFRSQISASIWGANITNERYRLACADNLNTIGYATCKWGDPRTYGVTIAAKF